MNLPNFWYGSCSYGPLWENHTLYAGKILIWQNFGHLTKIWPFFGQNWQFWDFLADNFQTQLSIFPIFGSPDVFTLRKEPINSLLCVFPFRSYSLDHSIFFYFLHEVVSPYDLGDHQKKFRSKNFLTPKMAKNGQYLAIFGQNSHFWVFLAYIFQTPL